jgi:hypothetical protein
LKGSSRCYRPITDQVNSHSEIKDDGKFIPGNVAMHRNGIILSLIFAMVRRDNLAEAVRIMRQVQASKTFAGNILAFLKVLTREYKGKALA